MKKLPIFLICAFAITVTTSAMAAETLQTYIFPAKIQINGEEKPLDHSEYEILNYNGHAYVPIRFVSEGLGKLVKFDKKVDINQDFIQSVSHGKLPGIEFGIGDSRNDILEKWGEPQHIGSRQTQYEAWFDFQYFFTGPQNTVGYIGIGGETIKHTVQEVKDVLGEPKHEGISLIEEGWELSYTFGEYALYFSADKKEGTITYMGLKKQ